MPSKRNLNFANRFLNSESKYGGIYDEDRHEFLEQIVLIANDFALRLAHRIKNIQNIFKGGALPIYNSEIRRMEETLFLAVKRIQEHFDRVDGHLITT